MNTHIATLQALQYVMLLFLQTAHLRLSRSGFPGLIKLYRAGVCNAVGMGAGVLHAASKNTF